MPKKLTTEQFVQRSLEIHNNKYDYSNSIYVGIHYKIKIICSIHGEFNQIAKNHLKGQGCKKCALVINSKIAQNSRRSNTDEFIVKAKLIHGDKFDYSLVKYINSGTKLKLICSIHGEFEQIPSNHLKGRGCERCANDLKKSNLLEFITTSTEVHGDKYIYSASTYTGCYNKITIVCPIHGNFNQMAYSHKQGRGCPTCADSTGEREVRKFLKNNSIQYLPQHKFDDCKNVFPLRFDFYLPEHNMCIEFDGLQHFKRAGYDKDGSVLKRTQVNDKIKNKYCHDNNISLLRINYKQSINETLKLYNF